MKSGAKVSRTRRERHAELSVFVEVHGSIQRRLQPVTDRKSVSIESVYPRESKLLKDSLRPPAR